MSDDATTIGGDPRSVDGADAPVPSEEFDDGQVSMGRSIAEWLLVIVGAVVIALVVRGLMFQPFWIPSESMEATLLRQDRVLVNKLSYRLGDISRGDVVVFERVESGPEAYDNLIKRVIGLGGDVVEGHDGAVYVNGAAIDEPYLDSGDLIVDFGPTTVPDGELFMMGDNRDESFDSRFFGTVPEDNVIGRAFVLFWPVDRLGTL